MPKFTVITPAFNCGPFLQQCIDSVLAQNYPDFEQIVVDGGSKDETVEVLKRNKHLRWVSEPDEGEADALNKALKMVTGDIVQWLNADDWMEPGVFARVAEVMNPAAGRHVVYGKTNMVDGVGKHLNVKMSDPNMSLGHLLRWWESRSHPHQPSCFYSVPMIKDLGPFRQDMCYSIDYEYWLRIIVKYKFTYLDIIMSSMRNRQDSKSIGIESVPPQIYSHWETSLPYHRYLSPQERIALWRDYYNIVVTSGPNHWYRDQVIMPPVTSEAVIGLAMVLSNHPDKARTEDLAGFILDHHLQSEGSRTLGHLARTSSLGRPVISPGKLLPGDIERPRAFLDWACAEKSPDLARLWKTILREWSADNFAKCLLVLDRGGAAPKFERIRYQDAPAYNPAKPQSDRRMIQGLCDRLGADIFLSIADTTPIASPSTVLLSDHIPAPLDTSRQLTITAEQQRMRQAATFIATSTAAQENLRRLYPQMHTGAVVVILPAPGEEFRPRTPEEIQSLRHKHSINKPYFLIVGPCEVNETTKLMFSALAALPDADKIQLLVASAAPLPRELAGIHASVVHLSDEELAIAYSGAEALLHVGTSDIPSLAALEAMATGCPVIAWPSPQLTEIAADAFLPVEVSDAKGVAQLLEDVRNPEIRKPLIERGIAQAAKHPAKEFAERIREAVVKTVMAIHARQAAAE